MRKPRKPKCPLKAPFWIRWNWIGSNGPFSRRKLSDIHECMESSKEPRVVMVGSKGEVLQVRDALNNAYTKGKKGSGKSDGGSVSNESF